MKIGFVASSFDLLHPGHLYLLAKAKKRCDHLIVGLHVDPSVERKNKNKPLQTVYERYVQLKACKYVGRIIPYETEIDLLNILSTRKIDVRFLGSDYEDKKEMITGFELVPIEFIPREHTYSSSELRERIKA